MVRTIPKQIALYFMYHYCPDIDFFLKPEFQGLKKKHWSPKKKASLS